MPRNRFEAISSFFHVVTPDEEIQLAEDPLKKIRPLYESIKSKCLELYQPLRELSVDERMVKSKARTHFRQYIRNKPTKWGFKFWVLADPTGFTINFELYQGKKRATAPSPHGLAYDVVMDLTTPFHHQNYFVFFDNFYTGPALIQSLKESGVHSTGTLRVTRAGVPESVKQLVSIMKRRDVPRGTGYYVRSSSIVYICWRDNDCVTVASNSFPGHEDGTAKRKGKNQSGGHQAVDVPLPAAIKQYNRFMGGVDKSDQLISYHRVLRQCKRYWKTLWYHLLEISATNAFILQKWLLLERNVKKIPTMTAFLDEVVLDIVKRHGTPMTEAWSTFTVRHGSKGYSYQQRRKCVICKKKTMRKCPDCPFSPALCQSAARDCHSEWHGNSFAARRQMWFLRQRSRLQTRVTAVNLPSSSSRKRSGRPLGQKNKKRKSVFS
jgi:hypothetical protein